MGAEFWERNSNGDLISQPFEINLSNEKIIDAVNDFKERLEKETDENKKQILQRCIELLEEEYQKSKQTHQVELIPLLSGEIRSINKGDNFDLNGLITTDREADICAKKCLKPKYSFEQWRDMKNPQLKLAVVNKIREISVPKSETMKQVFQMLRGL